MSICIFSIFALPRCNKGFKVGFNFFLNTGEEKGEGKYLKDRKNKQQLGVQKTCCEHHNLLLIFLQLTSIRQLIREGRQPLLGRARLLPGLMLAGPSLCIQRISWYTSYTGVCTLQSTRHDMNRVYLAKCFWGS